MNRTAVFTAAPEFTVLNGRTEIGRTDPTLLLRSTVYGHLVKTKTVPRQPKKTTVPKP
jgi:hypothetical protein